MPDDAEPDPAYWNAGIAATALSDWDTARWAWRAYGIPISGDDGPIDENFGQGVVRLPDGETVWGRRIDPARMQVLSVPLPDGGFRSDDIVLHDGEPVGSRVANGVEYSVFNVIERWKASSVPTISVEVEADDNAVADLLRLADSGGLRVENWTESIAIHCQACSLGRVDFDHPDHDHRPARKPNTPTRLGFSGELTRVRELLQGWTSDTEGTILDLAIYD
jgi:hypothetical protein